MATIISTGFGDRTVLTVDTDPTATSVNAMMGSLIIFHGAWFCKLTDGDNTDVLRIPTVPLISDTMLGAWNPSANLIAHYPLNDAASDSVVKDLSPNSFDGVMIGGNTTDISIAGLLSVGTAHDFNGTSHAHNIDAAIATGNLATATKGTLCCVIEPDVVATDALRFFSFGDANAATEIGFMQGAVDGTIKAWCRIAGTMQWEVETDNVVISNGVTAWVILVQDGVEPFFLIGDVANGMRKVLSTFSVTTDKTKWFNDAPGLDTGRIAVKEVNGNTGKYFNGTMDDARIYDTDWSLNDAIGWFNNGNGTQAESGMVPWTSTEALAFLITQSAAYTRDATIVEDRTLLASASATIANNNNVLAALIADLKAAGILG